MYNFQRTHSGIGGLVPADRFFGAAPDVLRTLKERVAANASELARQGVPKPPFYMTGQVGGQSFSVHAEGERVILRREGGARQEVELVAPETAAAAGHAPTASSDTDTARAAAELPQPLCPHGAPLGSVPEEGADAVSAPGVSPLDEAIEKLPPVRRGDEIGSEEGSSERKGGEA